MDVNVYMIKSALIRENDITERFFASVEKELDGKLETVSLEDYLASDFALLYVGSGGSEGAFVEISEKLGDRPCFILTSGDSNSLAASMEILSYIQARGKTGEIIHGDAALIAKRIRALAAALTAKKKLAGFRFGIVGEPSDWLIASRADEKALAEKLGAEVVSISMDELRAEIDKNSYDENEWTALLKKQNFDAAEVEKALFVYGAFARLVEKYKLGAVSVRCFDLLGTVETTGCLGLAILNALGVYGGCEGDMPSLISMAILGSASGKPVFMCNPSRIDTAAGEMVLAHCTLPVDMPREMKLTTHYESGIGVAIKGEIEPGACTIFKTSGDLTRYYCAAGEITENLNEPYLCRTQIKLKLDSFDYFLKNPINNHHLVCNGDYTAEIEEFFNIL